MFTGLKMTSIKGNFGWKSMTTYYLVQEDYKNPLGDVGDYKLIIHSRESKTLVVFT